MTLKQLYGRCWKRKMTETKKKEGAVLRVLKDLLGGVFVSLWMWEMCTEKKK